jgi:hypothetical protein
MLRHVVLLRFKPETTDQQRQAMVDGLRSLPAQIPEIRGYEVDLDAQLRETNFDAGLVALFDDATAFRTYLEHPAHVKVVTELIAPVAADRASIQFTL